MPSFAYHDCSVMNSNNNNNNGTYFKWIKIYIKIHLSVLKYVNSSKTFVVIASTKPLKTCQYINNFLI